MERSKRCIFLLLLFVLNSNSASHEEEDVDETYHLDLSNRGRTITALTRYLNEALEKCHLAPGKYVELVITPPEEVSMEFVEKVLKVVKKLLPSFFDTSDSTFKIMVEKDDEGSISKIKLGIHCGFRKSSIVGELLGSVHKMMKPFIVKISSLKADLKSKMKAILNKALSGAKKLIKLGKASSFVIVVEPPQGTELEFEKKMYEVLREQLQVLTSATCGFTININLLRDKDGALKKIEYVVNLFPDTPSGYINFEIDLTKPNVDYPMYLRRLLSGFFSAEHKGECPQINIQVKLAGEMSEEEIRQMVNVAQNILTEINPEMKFSVTTHIPETNPNGDMIDLRINCDVDDMGGGRSQDDLEVVVEDNDNQRSLLSLGSELVIDLTLPNLSIVSNLQKIMSIILIPLQAKLRMEKLVHLSFSVKPPRNQGVAYCDIAKNELLLALKKYFPDCLINAEYETELSSSGFLKRIMFDVTLEVVSGGRSQDDLEVVIEDNDNPRSLLGLGSELVIDLTLPNLSIVSNLQKIMSIILIPIQAKLRMEKLVHLSFSVKPPRNQGVAYCDIAKNELLLALKKYFPDCLINAEYETELSSSGFLKRIMFDVTLEVVSGGRSQDDLEVVIEDNDNPRSLLGLGSELVIDLTLPNLSIVSNLQKIMSIILIPIQAKLRMEKLVHLSFSVKPPRNQGVAYCDIAKNELLLALKKYFPDCRIDAEYETELSSSGFLKRIMFDVTLEVVSGGRSQDDLEVVVDDNANPRSLLDAESVIDLTLPPLPLFANLERITSIILTEIQAKLRKEKLVHLSFCINNPLPSEEEAYCDFARNELVLALKKNFPNCLINVETEKKPPPSPGDLSRIMIDVTVEDVSGGNRQDDLEVVVEDNANPRSLLGLGSELVIDLTLPNLSIVSNLQKIMSIILIPLQAKLRMEKLVHLSFSVKPPRNQGVAYCDIAKNELLLALKKFFPDCLINAEYETELSSSGFLKRIMFDVTLEVVSRGRSQDDLEVFENQSFPDSDESVIDLDLSRKSPDEDYELAVMDNLSRTGLKISLNKPGATVESQIGLYLPKILPNIMSVLNSGKSASFSLMIKPPKHSKVEYLVELKQQLLTILKTFFPNTRIEIALNVEKIKHGYIKKITCDVDVHPYAGYDFPQHQREEIKISLNLPGATLVSQIGLNLPRILPNLLSLLTSGKPASFSLVVKPPLLSTAAYLIGFQRQVLAILKTFFPHTRIEVIAPEVLKDNNGYITEIKYNIDVHPGTGNDFPRPPSEEITISLNKPGATLVSEIGLYLPRILPNLMSLLSSGKPCSFSLVVKPPLFSTVEYLVEFKRQLLDILKTFFPHTRIEIVTPEVLKDNNGYLTEIKSNIDVHPNTGHDSSQPQNEEITISLNLPGATLVSQIGLNLPRILPNLMSLLSSGKPCSFSLVVKPPLFSTVQYLVEFKRQLVDILKTFFPHTRIEIVTPEVLKDENGYLTKIKSNIDVHPKTGHDTSQPPNEEITISLNLPGATLVSQIGLNLPRILPNLMSLLSSGKPASFSLVVKPPLFSTIEYLVEFKQQLLDILKTFFPHTRIEMIAPEVSKDLNGYITEIKSNIDIHPYTGNDFPRPPSEEITISLNKPGATLVSEIGLYLPRILPNLMSLLSSGKPCSFSLVVKPPLFSTVEYLVEFKRQLLDILKTFFPHTRIEIVTPEVLKDNNGYLTEIKSNIDVHPNTGHDSSQPQNEEITISLNLPGATLVSQIGLNLPRILPNLMSLLSSGKPASFSLVAKPPIFSTVEYLVEFKRQLLDILKTFFPHTRIEIVTPKVLKDNNGYITEIKSNIDIHPDTGNDSSQPPNKEITISLNLPGATLLSQIGLYLPRILPNLMSLLTSGKPASFSLVVKPPIFSTAEYLVEFKRQLLDILKTFFPHTRIEIVTPKVLKDNNGYITEIKSNIDIQPYTGQVNPPPGTNLHVTKPGILDDITIKTDYDIEEIVISKLRERLVYIKGLLKNGKSVNVPFVFQFPSEVSKENLENLANMISSIFEQYFPYNTVELNLKATKNITKIDALIRPANQKNIVIDLAQPGQTMQEIIQQKLPEIASLLTPNLNDNKKVGVPLYFLKPGNVSPNIVLDTVRMLDEILKRAFPNQVFNFEIDTKHPPNFGIVVYPNTPQSPTQEDNSPANFMISVPESNTSPNDRIDETIKLYYPTLKPFLHERGKLALNLDMDLPAGSDDLSVLNIIDHLRNVLSQNFPKTSIGITPYVTRDSSNLVTKIHVEVTLQSYSFDESTQVENVQVDLSNPNNPINSEIQKMLPHWINVVRNHLNQQKPVTLNLNIRPPQGSTEAYLRIVSEAIVPLIASTFCNNKMKWTVSANSDLNGNLVDVLLSITFEPSGNLQYEDCQTTIDIDLTRPGSLLGVEIDKILPTVHGNIRMNLQQGKTVSLHFNINPPRGADERFLKSTQGVLMEILQNYFPYNEVSIRVSADKTFEGFLSNVLLTITVKPDKHPLPPANINLHLDLSRGANAKFQMKNILQKFATQIQALLSNMPSVSISFNIIPPRGAGEMYFKSVSSDLMNTTSEVIRNKQIQVQSKAAKNSKGEFFTMLMVVTITN